MKKRLLSIVLAVCMVLTLLPTMALAADPTGAFTVTGGTLGTDYSYASNTLEIKTSVPITIANTTPATATTTDKIVVNSAVDKTANITLAGVNIDLSGANDDAAAFEITSTAGAVNITLADGTTNTLKSGGLCAGLQKDTTAAGTMLTISGTGSLAANGGGAGISGAGIGGGGGTVGGTGSNITISGGTVNANGGECGIGGGMGGDGSNITISGGTVNANGGRDNFGNGGAGIGGGIGCSGSYITISGGTVTATGSTGGAGIGGGMGNGAGSSGSYITISGGTVNANGGRDNSGNGGAGIGGGIRGMGSNIAISGGTVNANGGAGIGGGMGGDGSNITISGGNVNASSIGVQPTNSSGTSVYKATFTVPNDTAGGTDVCSMTFTSGGSSYTYGMTGAKSILNSNSGKVYVYLPKGTATAAYGGKPYAADVNEGGTATFAFPTAAQYAAASPAAAADNDYVLDTANKTLTIHTAKGAAFWSASGTAFLDYTVKLANNIDVSAFQWTPVGKDYSNPFTGNFDGQGHTITGLTVNVSANSAEVFAGLFGVVSLGTVENVTISGSVSAVCDAQVYAGGIAGVILGQAADHLAYLKNCVSNVAVTAEVNDAGSSWKSAFAGGLTGKQNYTHTVNCVSNGSVNASSNSAHGEAYAGGLAGKVTTDLDTCVNNSYNTGAVSAVATGASGTAYAGGIAGTLDTDYLRNCYNTGTVSATYTGSTGGAGGIAGNVIDGGGITDCYYLASAATTGISAGSGASADGCGTFDTSGALTAGTAEHFGSAQTLAYTGKLLDALNGWVSTTSNADYLTWKADSGNTNNGYPVFSAGWASGYSITKSTSANGSYTVKVGGSEVTSAQSGDTVTITPVANSGYELEAISVYKISNSATIVAVSNNTFTMPAYAVAVNVTFKVIPTTAPTGGGTTTPTGVPVIVDGKTENIGTENKSGTSTTVTVDQTKLTSKIGSAAKDSSVVVPVGENGSAAAQLVVKNVEDMAAKGMTLTVQTGSVAYNLTTGAIDTAALAASFPGADMSKVPFDVTIKNSSVTFEGATLILSPVEFTVTATYGGTTVSVDTFSAFVDRTVEITAEQAAKITTAVVVNTDGSTRHVPTNVIEKDGKYYAVINSRTNSTYALIENKVTFTDAAGKWYEAAVNEMGSRKIISGRESGVFDGGASITRAEFAAILVRALGLPANGTSTFSDVSASGWYSGAVATAAQYGLVTGEGENKFDPAANISRQEAMAMLQRAAKLTTFAGTSGTLDSFTDLDSVGTWANDAAKWNVGSGLIQGADGKLNPNTNITRAESATIILRLLQKAGLVDVRSKV